MLFLPAAGGGGGRGVSAVAVAMQQLPAEDSLVRQQPLRRFPDTVYASVEALEWQLERHSGAESDSLAYLDDIYLQLPGTYTFRANQRRDMPLGKVRGEPVEIVKLWEFVTESDTTMTDYGVWYGSVGWTGQPVYVNWSDSLEASFRDFSPALTQSFSAREIIFGSLCRKIYFIDYETGRPSRQPIPQDCVIKGSVSLDPEYANLYVGHGVPSETDFGAVTIDLLGHEMSHFEKKDPRAWRGWGAYDGSAIVAGGYLFRPGENGSIYKYARRQGSLRLVSVLRYREKGFHSAAGIESSMAVCRNYGYTADNRGNILCINLDTMAPVWVYANGDDTDATIVLEESQGVPYLYSCTEVDRQQSGSDARFVKLNALTGELVWQTAFPCRKASMGSKSFDGGMFATPQLGGGNAGHLIFANICDHNPAFKGRTVAMDRRTGTIVWEHPLDRYAWSSPVGFCNESGRMYLFVADCGGNVYLLDALSGERLCKKKVGGNFEASPVVIEDCLVLGSRGNTIYKFKLQ